MRTTKDKNQPNGPKARSLKIQPKCRATRWSRSTVPELRLSGRWLEQLGFAPESRVTVHTSEGLIVILPQAANP